MNGTEKQIEFAKNIIDSRKALVVDFSEIKICGDWLSGDDGRSATDVEISAFNSLVSQLNNIDCCVSVISTKSRTVSELLKTAERVISTKTSIMNKDAYIEKLSARDLIAASELIQAI